MATHQKKHIKNNNNKSKELILCNKNNGEFYGQITGEKGDARFEVQIIQTNMTITAKARGSLINGPGKQRLIKKDYVLLQKDISTNDNKYYIIKKYSDDDVKKLKKSGELATIINNDENNNETRILFEGDILLNKIDEIEIDYEFIAGI